MFDAVARPARVFRVEDADRQRIDLSGLLRGIRAGVRSERAEPADIPSDGRVLSDATGRAAAEFGLTQTAPADVVGRHRSRLRDGIDPNGKSGELARLFVRVYRGRFALLGFARGAFEIDGRLPRPA